MTTEHDPPDRSIRPLRAESVTRRSSWMLGVPVDDITLSEAVDAVVDLVRDGREHGRTHQVATVNVDFVVNATRDRRQRSILRRTALSIPDGMPIVWGSRLLGVPMRERVAGADLVPALAERAADDGLRIALLGAAPGVADRAAEMLRAAHPGLLVVADAGPVFSSPTEISPHELASVTEFDPDICFVAFGNPKQELFIDRFRESLGVPVMVGVGGSLDFLVGVKRRAPDWMQATGLEWVHRAWTEPRRLVGRYARDAGWFGPALVRQYWKGRPVPGAGTASVERLADAILIDVRHVSHLDNRSTATVVSAVREARRTSLPIAVVGDPRLLTDPVGGIEDLLVHARDSPELAASGGRGDW